ncbi:hypothetical protein VNI00_005250 [Paramarasmius palmivorus]|uniref:Xylanolytic transcriptional activator regulatory domain-containing protein n=1 Tax=Paramarasmius palmivorus TaxID=297713 RepID=A0AAW0DDX0_9AGAR
MGLREQPFSVLARSFTNPYNFAGEPRRRGPPSGYLRYTETRAALLETLLGHLILSSASSIKTLADLLLESVNTLRSESKSCTQDVWDLHKSAWLSTEAARGLDELANTFSPFPQRTEQDSFAKPLLPTTAGTPAKTDDASSPPVKLKSPPTDQDVKSKSVSFAIQPEPTDLLQDTLRLTPRESFERSQPLQQPSQPTSSAGTQWAQNDVDDAVELSDMTSPATESHVNGRDFSGTSPGNSGPLEFSGSGEPLDVQMMDIGNAVPQTLLEQTGDAADILMSAVDSSSLGDIGSYTGSYWRTAELALSELSVLPIDNYGSGTQSYPNSAYELEHASNMQNFDSFDSHHTGSITHFPFPSTPSAFATSPPSYPLSSNLTSASLGTITTPSSSHGAQSSSTGFSELFSSPVQVPNESVDLPPSHIVSALLDVYYGNVHVSFPFLPPREGMNVALSHGEGDVSIGNGKPLDDGTTCLLLALCAYTGRLAPGMSIGLGLRPDLAGKASRAEGALHDVLSKGSGKDDGDRRIPDPSGPNETGDDRLGFAFGREAGKIAADLWYEKAREALNPLLRKPGRLETVQALLLLALRDHGKGAESQAWLLVGLAIRMGQELQLSSLGTSSADTLDSLSEEERQQRQNVWAISLVLDMFLSLQLGKAPGVADCLREAYSVKLVTAGNPTTNYAHFPPKLPDTVFLHTYELCQIISRINFYLYLGFGPQIRVVTGASSSDLVSISQEKLSILRTELDMWHQSLPMQYRIAIGHQPERDVLEINMYYHVALILLYRPFMKNEGLEYAREAYLDAASTFSVLLEKYKNLYYTPPVQHTQPTNAPSTSSSAHPPTPTPVPAIYFSNPNMIFLIFTVALAHLSGHRLRRNQQANPQRQSKPFQDLQTQLHLLNCLEALKAIGGTWELSRRCWKTVDRLMKLEGLKPGQNGRLPATAHDNPMMSDGLGKRKRERVETDEHSPSSQRQRNDTYAVASSATGSGSLSATSSSKVGQSHTNWNVPIEEPTNMFDSSVADASLADYFGQSSGWFPELPELLDTDLSSLASNNAAVGVWDGEWDNRLWDSGTWMS